MFIKRLLSKAKNIHFLSLLGTGSMSVIIFIFTAILFRSLSPEECGIWFFFQTMFSFLDTFRQGFLNTAFVKFYTGSSKERAQEVIGSTWAIATSVSLILILANIIALIFIAKIPDQSLKYFLKYFGINLFVSLPMVIAMCITQGDLKFDRLLYIRLCQVLLLISFLLLLKIFKLTSLTNLMYANILATSLTSILTMITGWSAIKYFFKKSKKCVLELYNFGKYTVGTSISTNLFGVIDSTIITFMLGPSALSIYNLGKRFIEVVEIPLRSFVATALPILSNYYNHNSKDDVIFTTKKFIGGITIGLIPLLIITYIISGFLIGLVGGGQYIGTHEGAIAINILRILLVFSVISPADRFLSVALDVIHKPQVNFYKIIIMLIINLLTDLLGIYIWGNVYGVVILGIFTILIAVIIEYGYLRKKYYIFNLLDSYVVGFKFVINLLSTTFLNKKIFLS